MVFIISVPRIQIKNASDSITLFGGKSTGIEIRINQEFIIKNRQPPECRQN